MQELVNNPIIEIKNLNVKRKEHIIKNLNLKINRGELIYIIGPNGAGKTTLVRALLGLEDYDGEIKIFGKDRKTLTKKELEKIGYVPQVKYINLEVPITVNEVLSYYARDKTRLERLMKEYDVETLKNKLIRELSQGQLQRVFIVRALLNDPEILILDEGDTALDVKWRKELYSTIERLNKQGKTIIMITHDLTIMRYPESKILCLNKTLYIHGKKEKISINKNLKTTYGCPLEFIAHGKIPHRILEVHDD